jgi:hypothetical protein
MTEIIIDAEFKRLIPALTDEEFSGLEASILEEGRARVPLDLWNGILIDGHNRYMICQRHDLPFTTQEVGTPDWTRTDALIWIIQNQFNRRNLSAYARAELALKLQPLWAEKAKENLKYAEGGDRRGVTTKSLHDQGLSTLTSLDPATNSAKISDFCAENTLIEEHTEQSAYTQSSDPELEPYQNVEPVPAKPRPVVASKKPVIASVNTRAGVAKAAGIGDGTMYKASIIAAKADDATKEKLRRGDTTIDREYKEIVKEEKQREREERYETIIKNLPDRTERYHVIHCSVADLPIDNESVDCIITDPPYPEGYLSVYASLAATAARVLKPGGSCFVMVGQSYLPDIIADLSAYLTYHWTIAYMTPGGQSTQLWQRRVNTFWKPVLWFVKDEYKGEWIGDVAVSKPNDNDKRFHHWGQSESGMADLVRRFSEPGHVILDPFVGGGTTGVVALDLGRMFIGCDVDADCVARTIARLNEGISDAA